MALAEGSARRLGLVSRGLLLLSVLLAPSGLRAASVTAVPALDLGRFTGAWFIIEQYPTKFQKKCAANDQLLYALGDKTGHYQLGNFCMLKNTSPSNINYTGTRDKFDDGRLKVNWLVIFSKKYWVLALGPNYDWAVLGTPNHKSLWILSRTQTLDPAALQQAQAVATAQGFSTDKLVTIRQIPPGYTDVAVASAKKEQQQ